MKVIEKTGFQPEKWATLYVIGKNFGGGIVFGYVWGRWWVWSCPPYLRAALGITAVEDIGKKLTKKGFSWQWISESESTT